MNTDDLPKTLLEAVAFFADEERAHAFFVAMRWPAGVHCTHCGSQDVGGMVVAGKNRNRRLWNCKSCKRQFTAKVGTVMEDSPLPLSKWMPALWLVVNAKNGISSCELARALGITQKSAWHMGHRIRAAIQRGGGIVRADGVFECDESFIGGKARNMHADKRAEKIKGTGPAGKTAVMGLLARHSKKVPVSQVVARVAPSVKRKELMKLIREHIPAGAEIHTDELASYAKLSEEYEHKVVNHAECYVKDGVHTNGLENFWSLFKRGINGTYVHCAPFHLFRYLDEQTYRFNERKNKDDDLGRFLNSVHTAKGRRLTWKKLTGKLRDESL